MAELRIASGSEKYSEFLPFKTITLTEKLKRKARDELGETEEKVREGIVTLSNFIEKNKLPLPKDDHFLLMFLRGQKFRLNEAQEILRRFVAIQEEYVDVTCMDFSVIRKILDHKLLGILPYRDEEGRTIIVCRGGIWTPELCEADDVQKCLQALLYFALQYPPTSVSGYSLLIDGGIRSANEVFEYLSVMKHMASLVRGYPGRIQKVNMINVQSLMRFAMNTIRYILPKKLSERINIYGSDKESLLQSFDPSILPKEFGGTLPSISCDEYVEDLKIFLETLRSSLDTIYGNKRNR